MKNKPLKIACFTDSTSPAQAICADIQMQTVLKYSTNIKELLDGDQFKEDFETHIKDAICVGLFVPLHCVRSALWPKKDWINAADHYHKSTVFKKYAGREIIISPCIEDEFIKAVNKIHADKIVAKYIGVRKALPTIVCPDKANAINAFNDLFFHHIEKKFEEVEKMKNKHEYIDQKIKTMKEIMADMKYSRTLKNVEESCILIQEHIPMYNEYRVFIVDGKPVTGAGCIKALTPKNNQDNIFDPAIERIRGKEKALNKPDLVKRYIEFATIVSKEFKAENPLCLHYTLDLATNDKDEIIVIELNSLYNMGLYACQYERLFEAILETLGYQPSPRYEQQTPLQQHIEPAYIY
ncbi:MAG: ATP-grasp domain-containing protein [Alphaproteobacteria bacterium]|nr:ATP-grasp domain-containing protein [Alphaproteobacteria bacterium]